MSSSTNPTRLLGLTLAIFTLVTAIAFGLLSSVFKFPDVLRMSGDEVLPLFGENASTVRPLYWVLTMTGLVMIAVSTELGRVLAAKAPGPSRLVSGFGIATGVFWALGYARWPITVPYLSELYRSGEKQRANELYELLNRYAGMTVGEHLGFVAMGAFAIALAVGVRRAQIGPKWLFPVGMFSGVLIAVTAYEQYDSDAELLGALNGVANTVWFLWLLALGVVLYRTSAPIQREAAES